MKQTPRSMTDEWQRCPRKRVRLIARVEGDLPQRRAELEALGATVTHAIRLTNSLAFECSGALALVIASQSWVRAIAADTRVSALGRQLDG